jgi:outer membrane murein-binding lipoprotein Lpp
LFDKAHNTFYPSASSVAFTGGEEITERRLFGYKLYWKSEDDGRKIRNQFDYNDQILCQTFNVAEGESYSANNKFYWMLCDESGYETTTIDGTEYECNYVIVNNADKDINSNAIPEAGDEIVQLGNRNNSSRQNAIIISAYNNQFLDSAIVAPSIVQYSGINNYNLSSHRLNVISNGYNSFKGSYTTNSGDDIEQLIEDVSAGTTAYLHTAYANSADGATDFTKVNTTGNYLYIGFCSNYNSDDSALVYSDYTWNRLKGDTGEASDIYTLVPVIENVNVNADGVCSVSLAYNIIKQDGSSYSMVQATDNLYVQFYPYYQQTIQIRPTQLSRNTVRPSYSNNAYQRNWSSASDKLEYIQVELVIPPTTQYGVETVIDKRIVYVKYSASAQLEITDSIKATVQGNYEELSGDITTINNSISTLEQNYDSISATVNSHTTQIDTNRTDIANLTIRANEISSTVSQQGTEIENLESEITQTAEEITLNITNQLNQTGINIQDGVINLYGENTNIVGNLNIYNSDEGLVIYDSNNNARIQIKNDTLGNLEDFDFGSDKLFKDYQINQLSSTTTTQATFNFNLGSFAVGNNITISGTNITGYINNQFDLPYSVSYNVIIVCGST